MIIEDGYIVAIRNDHKQYSEIMRIFSERPVAPEGYRYRLKIDLTWELCELPPVEAEEDPELSAEEALDLIVNGGDGNA